MTPAPAERSIDDLVLRVADAVGGLMEAWGFRRNLGRLWTVLYLEDRPLSAAELGDRLALSTGAVSMVLGELQKWGAVHKTWQPGERRDYYAAETSIWKMVSRVLRERELHWITTALEAFERAELELAARAATTDPRLRLIRERVGGLVELARTGAHLLAAILEGGSIDALPIKKLSTPR